MSSFTESKFRSQTLGQKALFRDAICHFDRILTFQSIYDERGLIKCLKGKSITNFNENSWSLGTLNRFFALY